MGSVLTALRAVFFQLQLVGSVNFISFTDVILRITDSAFEGHDLARSFFCHVFSFGADVGI